MKRNSFNLSTFYFMIILGIFSILPILAQSVKITYIANEGVMISAGDKQVLIDAIHKEYYPQYLATDATILKKMFAETPPFASVDIVLASHIHRDHFHGKTIADYLKKVNSADFFATAQVIDSVRLFLKDSDINEKRLISAGYRTGEKSVYEKNDIRITNFKIDHGSERFSWIENSGHLIEIEGKKILHIGDPAFGAKDIQAAGLVAEKIDVAILPYWFLINENGRSVIEQWIQPRQIVAAHIPPARNADAVSEIKKHYPAAIIFTEPIKDFVILQ